MRIFRKTIIAAALLATSATGMTAQNTRKEADGLLTEKNSQTIYNKELKADIVVAGGGIAGVCAAVSAARSSWFRTARYLEAMHPAKSAWASSEQKATRTPKQDFWKKSS